MQCFGAAWTRTDAGLIDPIEGRWVKNGRLEIVLNEPLAFYAARTRPRPWGRVSDHEAHDHHASAAAQLHFVADPEFHAGFYIGSLPMRQTGQRVTRSRPRVWTRVCPLTSLGRTYHCNAQECRLLRTSPAKRDAV